MKHNPLLCNQALPDYTRDLHTIERESGPVSDAVKALLITDGSVTSLLECFSGARVTIRTFSQEVIPAPADIATDLDLCPGDPVNHRVVGICDKEMDLPLIHAVSYCPVHRLPEHARLSLMQADIPIGHILKNGKMESRREIVSIRTVQEDRASFLWKADVCRRLFARKYKIIHQNKPIFRIEEFVPEDLFPRGRQVTIRTPSRLHLALIDMNGALGRVDGGIGITLDRPGYVIKAEPADETTVLSDNEPARIRALEIIQSMAQNHGYSSGLNVQILETMPPHNGLGSGTQLSLAIATAMHLLAIEPEYSRGEGIDKGNDAGLYGFDAARLTHRGGTSGIGVRAFSEGGVILDGGHRFGPGKVKESYLPSSASVGVSPPPLIGRYEFPEDWRIILCLPSLVPGANGSAEKTIFEQCCPVPLHEVQQLSHIILMQMIPSLIEGDLDQFGQSVSSLQHVGFKREELALQPPALHEILEYMDTCGTAGAGMSSFGPALYAICDTNCSNLAGDIKSFLNERCEGEVMVVRGRNTGASIRENR
jgi:beta-ribofuranosylaminobenzene 5'-phosphate synthase